MLVTIEENVENLASIEDFLYLVDKYLGFESKDYLVDYLKGLNLSYISRIEELEQSLQEAEEELDSLR